ncbi:MAG TPA: hypothetical protein VI540_09430 [Gaiellaceae bacterium]|nr:hypothetical protein [Gaiellaceae bacterium]
MAISGKSRGGRNRKKKPNLLPWLATGCRERHGKEGVDGSSPSEGFGLLHRRHLVLVEVSLDELGEREHPRAAVGSSQLLECSLERRPRILFAGKAAALNSLRVASAGAVAMCPKLAAVASDGCELEDLSLLDHRNSSPVARSDRRLVRRFRDRPTICAQESDFGRQRAPEAGADRRAR